MLSRSLRILNFDGSVLQQKRLISKYDSNILDLKDLGPKARFWMGPSTASAVKAAIKGSSKSSVTFLGSGDFHHVSALLLNEMEAPISVVDFDFHPDWHLLPPRLNCGSWVTAALKNKLIRKFVLIGVSSDDLRRFSIESANFQALQDDRLEIYPYSCHPTTVFFRNIPRNISVNVKGNFIYSRIYWSEINDKDLPEFFLQLVKRLPSKRVYITIDKDCLKKGYSLTNWEEGRMELEDLLLMLKIIKENADIVGLDIVGDYSDIIIDDLFKRAVSRLDHPKKFSANGFDVSEINRINEETNIKILETLYS